MTLLMNNGRKVWIWDINTHLDITMEKDRKVGFKKWGYYSATAAEK